MATLETVDKCLKDPWTFQHYGRVNFDRNYALVHCRRFHGDQGLSVRNWHVASEPTTALAPRQLDRFWEHTADDGVIWCLGAAGDPRRYSFVFGVGMWIADAAKFALPMECSGQQPDGPVTLERGFVVSLVPRPGMVSWDVRRVPGQVGNYVVPTSEVTRAGFLFPQGICQAQFWAEQLDPSAQEGPGVAFVFRPCRENACWASTSLRSRKLSGMDTEILYAMRAAAVRPDADHYYAPQNGKAKTWHAGSSAGSHVGRQLSVVIPPSWRPGAALSVKHPFDPSKTIEVQVPPGGQPGMTLDIPVPDLQAPPPPRWQEFTSMQTVVPKSAILGSEHFKTDGQLYIGRASNGEIGKVNVSNGFLNHLWCHHSGRHLKGEVLCGVAAWQAFQKGDAVPADAFGGSHFQRDGQVLVGVSQDGEIGKITLSNGNLHHLWCHHTGKHREGKVLVLR
mmetsp:Transcript_74994/g.171915  ORF Transcript_74994/g.171915 Transcript_74994/m.171915 type:complete len:450 (-) Transcript_74994:25-1374(-)